MNSKRPYDSSKCGHLLVARVVAIGLVAVWGQQPCAAMEKLPHSERLQLIWRDGTTTVAADIDGWSKSETSGERTLDSASIGGKPVFGPQPSVRLVRNRLLSTKQNGPFIQLANGDILPGYFEPLNQTADSRESHFVSVSIFGPLFAKDSRRNQIQVRRDSIARIKLSSGKADAFAPGLIAFRDGPNISARSIRWNSKGIRLLSDQSVKAVAWADIEDVHLPRADRMQAILQDALVELPQDADFLGRMVTTDGAVLTYHRHRIRIGLHRGRLCHIVQPAWALNAIYVPVDSVVSTSYRSIDEIPLSLLPATLLKRHSVFGETWKWKRNCNVKGLPLSSGKLRADMGIGMWSHREIAFELPPAAVAFSAWVGIDNAVGEGGCVRCKIYRDEVSGNPIWTSGLLQSGKEPVRVEVANLKGARRLVLVAEFAHEDRQKGDLPFDIRDMVAWLSPVVQIDGKQLPSVPLDIEKTFPELAGWSITEETRKRISIRSFHDARRGTWRPVMVLDKDRNKDETVEPLVLTKKFDVKLTNAWLVGATGRDDVGKFGHRLIVKANGKHIRGTEGYDSNTTGYGPGDLDTVAYGLGEFVGQKVQVTVSVHPMGNEHALLCGLLWGELSLSPLIEDLPDGGDSIQPDLLLTSLPSLKVEAEGDGDDALKLLLSNPTPRLRWFPMKNSFEMTVNAKAISCEIDPRARRFVACIGPSQAGHGEIGAFQVWLDDKMLWQSGRITRLTKAQQIDIQLPAGQRKRLILRVGNKIKKPMTWGNAGFMFD